MRYLIQRVIPSKNPPSETYAVVQEETRKVMCTTPDVENAQIIQNALSHEPPVEGTREFAQAEDVVEHVGRVEAGARRKHTP